PLREPHSFPTRRSSDLGAEEVALSRALHRQGRFVVLREFVTTSGRKLRAYSAREVLGLMARLALAGPTSVRRREGLEIWYGQRRDRKSTRLNSSHSQIS